MRNKWFGLVCVVGMLLVSGLVYGQLPERVPMHWDINGNVDRFGSRLEAALVLPSVGALIWGLLFVLPRIDPRRAAYREFRGTFYLMINAVLLLLTAIHGMALGIALGWSMSVPRVIGVGAGLLFAVIGNELGRVRPNWFVGIRTPWTLANAEVWRRTHRVGGRVFFVVGLVMAVASLMLPPEFAVATILGGALGTAFFAVAYSYVLWRRVAA